MLCRMDSAVRAKLHHALPEAVEARRCGAVSAHKPRLDKGLWADAGAFQAPLSFLFDT